ncbi:MAG TPA: ABC transporter ATP-binding protein [Micromonosporaceae bacterium]|nr:ABC transporter ATP-binding protein [Micromonosporaceae bacterium]
MIGLTLPPYLVSRAVDDGLRPRDLPVLAAWSAAIFAVTLVNAALGLMRHRTMSYIRIGTSLRVVGLVARRAVHLGDTLSRRVSTGEVVNIGTADMGRIAEALIVFGPGFGGVVAYAVVTLLLLRVSVLLAVVVVLGVPVVVIVVGPLLGRLQRREATYREHQGNLAARAGDIVAGLRVLSGIGGKDAFAARYRQHSRAVLAEGYRVGATTSWVQAVAVGVPVLFLAAVVWLAARMAASGEITVGEMTAVYGYVAVLVGPVSFVIESMDSLARGLVSARRALRILGLARDVPDDAPPGAASDPGDLRDPDSGLVVPADRMTAVASADAASAAAIVNRLGRYVDPAATWGTSPLSGLPLTEVRRRIVVADNDAHLFAGTLREAVMPGRPRDDDALRAAVHAAAADDIVERLPGGLDGWIEEKGRNLSGGQAQRLRLTRALLADADILLLVEPTSAVDVLTEAQIAARLRTARHGRATVVVSTSPLMLAEADTVAYVSDGRVVATGTHADLLDREPGYRALVLRGADEGEQGRRPGSGIEVAP